jgi:hypothetical protein
VRAVLRFSEYDDKGGSTDVVSYMIGVRAGVSSACLSCVQWVSIGGFAVALWCDIAVCRDNSKARVNSKRLHLICGMRCCIHV